MSELLVIGGGPAGLKAAEVAAAAGVSVELIDAMPSVGRKFLLAGIGGLNLSHAEPLDAFLGRYGERAPAVAQWLCEFDRNALRAWAASLGIATFVGSSQRVFPVGMKAAPLLRAWLKSLRHAGVQVHARQRWVGFSDDGAWRIESPTGTRALKPRAVVLALGGASWSRLGSDGAWVPWLTARGVDIAPWQPANVGFALRWSDGVRAYAGAPLKNVALTVAGATRRGELLISDYGLEGSLLYAFGTALRDRERVATLDLKPALDAATIAAKLALGAPKLSLPNRLKKLLPDAAARALLLDYCDSATRADPDRLAARIKAIALQFDAPRPLDEAISSAGGVRLEVLSSTLELNVLPGVFCAGEMLDWEAPTGGYLLSAVIASGAVAGRAAAARVRSR
jgi:uncharacterized flavoprotein (TIGR03862 family)